MRLRRAILRFVLNDKVGWHLPPIFVVPGTTLNLGYTLEITFGSYGIVCTLPVVC